jgi:glycosyltransferase involved in cell wall biosynthesis
MTDEAVSERITYLVACFNREAYVADCLRSLHAQTDPRWLAIVLDDASTDGSADRIRPLLDDRMRLVVNETNAGYIAALERMIEEAGTDIVAILDADDAIEPEATAMLLAAYARGSGAEFVYSRFSTWDEAMSRRTGEHGGPVPDGGTAIRDGPVGAIRSFRRSAYRRTSGLDPTLPYAEDRDLVYKLEEVTRPVFVDVALYRYRRVPDSQSVEPRKREIGAVNVRRARRAALDRRGCLGLERLAAELMIASDYIAYSGKRPRPIRRVGAVLAGATAAAWRRIGSPAASAPRA